VCHDSGVLSVGPRRLLVAIWIFFVCKGAFYSVLFPLWEGYDEYAHFAFVQFVAMHHELPVPATVVSREVEQSLELVPLPWQLQQWRAPHATHDLYWRLSPQERIVRERELSQLAPASQTGLGVSALYEGQQGPLYYSLMAPLHSLFKTTSLPTRVLLFRLINVLLASTIVPITFSAARTFFDDEYAVGSCALLAAMPELFIDTARVGNQTLTTVLFGVLTLLCLLALEGKVNYLVIGTMLGLLLLSKAYALAAIPAVFFVLLYTASRSENRIRSFCLAAVSVACTAALAGWWYVRNSQLVGSLVWISSTPARPMSLIELVRDIPQVSWGAAASSVAGSYLWFGDWSFLTVRSWIYEALEILLVLVVIGFTVKAIQSLRSQPGAFPVAGVLTLGLMFGAFLAAIAYHVLVTFINSGVGTSCGWYLYAVVVPGAILAIIGVMGFGRYKNVLLLALTGSFVALELYATNWVLIPYYTGLISHNPNGALQSFHPVQAGVSFPELLARLCVNRPFFITESVVFILWALYLISTVGVFCVVVFSSRVSD